jgi:hypothetical protein
VADAQMQFLYEGAGRRWYFAAPGHFARPGLYFWNGNENVHIDDALPLAEAEERPVGETKCPHCEGGAMVERRMLHCWTCGGTSVTRDQFKANTAARQALSAAPREVAGWVRVPVEPTAEMLKAVRWEEDAFGGKSAWPSDIYKAMLAAAPQEGTT